MGQAEATAVAGLQNTCAIVITYNPDAGFPDRLRKILRQIGRVLLIDNGSRHYIVPNDLALFPGLLIHVNSNNFGIGEALNQGMTLAVKEGYEWAILFDQDTDIYPSMVETLIGTASQYPGTHVLVGSNYLDVHRGRTFHHCRVASVAYGEKKTLITSGTLLPLRFALNIGGFRSDYFLDSVDHEFCLRARANECASIITCKVVMAHRIGSPPESGGRLSWYAAFNHAPGRKYLIARNVLLTIRKHYAHEPLWVAKEVLRLAVEFASIIFFEREKAEKLRAFLKGLHHGMVGRSGPPTGFSF